MKDGIEKIVGAVVAILGVALGVFVTFVVYLQAASVMAGFAAACGIILLLTVAFWPLYLLLGVLLKCWDNREPVVEMLRHWAWVVQRALLWALGLFFAVLVTYAILMAVFGWIDGR
jgi:membrane protease YdiL (CAAX protease family)